MRKPKIQPFIPLVLRRPQVIILLLKAHGIPDSVTRLVPPDIITLDEDGHDHVPGNQCKEDLVSSTVVRLIVFAVNLHAG